MAIINYVGKHLITYDVIVHSHEYWEIIYTTQGSGNITTSEGVNLNYGTNEVIVIPPNVVHTNKSNSGFNNIHLTINNWQPNIKETTLITDNSSLDLLSAIKQVHHYFHLSFPGKSNVIFALTELIVSYVEMLAENPVPSSITQIIENEIINNYTDPSFEIEQAFGRIPYSKEYIRKTFIKDRGMSPLQFLINKRIMCAAKLLAMRSDNDLNIREISEKCGFTDQLYFSRIFKQIIGVSPKNYLLQELNDNKVKFDNDTENETIL